MNVKFEDSHKDYLRNQVITDESPGPILRDFQMLLDFLGPSGVEVQGKHHLLPLRYIDELDQRLSRPLRLQLKRPQIRSHPYLQGLNLLLRASGLTKVQRNGSKTRLVLDPIPMEDWEELNPTERYFNLLEAWLIFGRPEMVGDTESPFWRSFLLQCFEAWRDIPPIEMQRSLRIPKEFYLSGIYRGYYQLALMDLFGLLKVEHPSRPIKSWVPETIQHVPFGDAVFSLLYEYKGKGQSTGISIYRPELEEAEEVEQEEERVPQDYSQAPEFGIWQALFQPYFPDWQENLEIPEPEFREGVFLFKVSLGSPWRKIGISAEDSLESLVEAILVTFRFDSDHLYELIYRDRLGVKISAFHPMMDEGPYASEIPIGSLPLDLGQTMDLVYDFGENWHFTIKLEEILPPNNDYQRPRILRRQGEAPKQYPNWDEDEEDEDEGEESEE